MTKQVLSTSDNGHYVNLVGRGRTGVTLMPINARFSASSRRKPREETALTRAGAMFTIHV
jgi:hypothetical protein